RERVRFVHYGGECYQYGLLASGFIDLVVEADMAPYDYCALIPVVQGAGGVITDWRGRSLGLESDGRVLAAAGAELHAAAMEVLAG
ncbi:MAG: inositol monophosphatase family protein, partial [Alphaproteobacteria bacterium]